ncbi:MAG: HlyD family efflux transporter periplasmic adaptor subunit [Scytonematopsis contorta HA4267-MV1]|jgi:HlyD family secretion protein|nr:HlyD family efflux transporter periplasmic adaptor subunit [Scytonematopsis contorta HA4267-MV1]
MQIAVPKIFQNFQKRWQIILALGVGTVGIAFAIFLQTRIPPKQQALSDVPVQPVKAVTSLGRLEPQGEVIQLAASTSGSRIGELLVKVGDKVQQGQIIAILDTRNRLKAALLQAKQRVDVAKTRLAQVKAGAKRGEIDAQQATVNKLQTERRTDITAQQAAIGRLQAEQNTEITAQKATIKQLEAELKNAQLEDERHQFLFNQGVITASLRDSKRLVEDIAKDKLNEARAQLSRIESSREQQIREAQAKLQQIQTAQLDQIQSAKATLDKIAEVRPVDVRAAEADVKSAAIAVQQAQAELDLAYIRAPRSGQILKIHTWSGEIVDSQKGIASLGQTSQMYAVAEVYETDLPRIRTGQKAKVTSVSGGSLAEAFEGVVDEVGLEIAKKDVLNTDPAAQIDARVVEVKIRLNSESSRKVAGLTNMKVRVEIEL